MRHFERRPRGARALIGALLIAAACTPPRPAPGTSQPARDAASFRVAVLGDMPYAGPQDPQRAAVLEAYRAVLDTIAAEPVAFVVHVGDITGAVCSDSLYAQRAREFAAVPHPLVYTFGDNEWTDCARDTSEVRTGRDPLERLARLRALFAGGGASLGGRPMPLDRQSADARFAAFRENARWRRGGVRFFTLHVVGSNNNWGRDTAPSAEYVQRNAANLAWMRETFALAEREGARGVAVFMQANPLVPPPSRPDGSRAPSGFRDVVQELQRLAAAFGRPVALVHGDTHAFRVDQPIPRPGDGLALTTLTRAETYGSPNHHALLMTVDPGHPHLFRFEPLLVRQNARR